MTRRRRLTLEVLQVALGAVLAFVGLVVLGRQGNYYIATAHWPEYSLLDLIMSPTVKLTVPAALLSWVNRPELLQGLHATMVTSLDVVPASLFFLGVGGFTLWKGLR